MTKIQERYLKSHKKLAVERTILANERNSLAYIRTGFSAFVLGLALVKLFSESTTYLYTGYVSLSIGIVFILLGLLYYPLRKRKINAY